MNEQEKKIQELENQRRAIVEEMNLEMYRKESFLDGCKRTLLTIQTDEDQQKKIEERVEEVESLISKGALETRKKYEEQLKPIISDLVGCYLSIGRGE